MDRKRPRESEVGEDKGVTENSSSSSSSSLSKKCNESSIALPSKEDERTLFNLWLAASMEEAKAVILRPSNDDHRGLYKQQAKKSHNAYLDASDRVLKGCDLVYDPHQRSFIDAFTRIDAQSSRLFFQYFPIAAAASMSSPAPPFNNSDLKHRYHLEMLSPATLSYRWTVKNLEKYLIRRYRHVYPQRVAVFVVVSEEGGEEDVIVTGPSSIGVTCKVYKIESSGGAFNQTFHRIMNDKSEAAPDVIVLWRSTNKGHHHKIDFAGEDVNLFYPAYPVVLTKGQGMMFTPIHIYQLNGCLPSSKDVVQSLLDRTSGILGAVLVQGSETRMPSSSYDTKSQSQGLSSFSEEEGLQKDHRVYHLRQPLASHVPKNRHGWLSIDTKILLATALAAYRPKAILELGTWYGLSSRFILSRAPSDVKFYTVDWFKNNGLYAAKMDDITPIDKLYLTHLRFETFHANIQDFNQQGAADEEGRSIYMIRMDIHEAVNLCIENGLAIDMVFIDAEKKTQRLLALLQKIIQSFPRATIVGDDYVFDSVKKAVEMLNIEDRLITRDESYLILPLESREGASISSKAEVLDVMRRLEADLSLPSFQKDVLKLIEEGKDEEAVSLAQKHGLGLSDELYSPAKSIIHEICRRRDEAAVQFLEKAIASNQFADGVPLNDVGLTPFDYLTHKINFS